jgi:D-serine deaminase-like pyridoxal phosphate-dependent protein
VVEVDDPDACPVGSVIYGIPWHICPTVALHAEVIVVTQGRATARWRVTARDRTYRA